MHPHWGRLADVSRIRRAASNSVASHFQSVSDDTIKFPGNQQTEALSFALWESRFRSLMYSFKTDVSEKEGQCITRLGLCKVLNCFFLRDIGLEGVQERPEPWVPQRKVQGFIKVASTLQVCPPSWRYHHRHGVVCARVTLEVI